MFSVMGLWDGKVLNFPRKPEIGGRRGQFFIPHLFFNCGVPPYESDHEMGRAQL